jgi:hypothetical protein
VLPKYGEKPEQWQPSEIRVKGGLFITASNFLLNTDANGAANVVRKVAFKLGFNLSGISRVSLIAPLKIHLFRNHLILPTASSRGEYQVIPKPFLGWHKLGNCLVSIAREIII